MLKRQASTEKVADSKASGTKSGVSLPVSKVPAKPTASLPVSKVPAKPAASLPVSKVPAKPVVESSDSSDTEEAVLPTATAAVPKAEAKTAVLPTAAVPKADAKAAASKEEEEEEGEACSTCGGTHTSKSNAMLLCDGAGCEQAFHQQCLVPPLQRIPPGEWRCPTCSPVHAAAKEPDSESSSSTDAEAPVTVKAALEFANDPQSTDVDDEETATTAPTKKTKQDSKEGGPAKPAAAKGSSSSKEGDPAKPAAAKAASSSKEGDPAEPAAAKAVKRGRVNSADSGSAPKETPEADSGSAPKNAPKKKRKKPKPAPEMPPESPSSSSNEGIVKRKRASSSSSEDSVGSKATESSSSEELLDVTPSAVENAVAEAAVAPTKKVGEFVDEEKIECIVDCESKLNKFLERNSRGLVYRKCANLEERVGKKCAKRIAETGSTVDGTCRIVDGFAWLETARGLFLPTFVSGCQVMWRLPLEKSAPDDASLGQPEIGGTESKVDEPVEASSAKQKDDKAAASEDEGSSATRKQKRAGSHKSRLVTEAAVVADATAVANQEEIHRVSALAATVARAASGEAASMPPAESMEEDDESSEESAPPTAAAPAAAAEAATAVEEKPVVCEAEGVDAKADAAKSDAAMEVDGEAERADAKPNEGMDGDSHAEYLREVKRGAEHLGEAVDPDSQSSAKSPKSRKVEGQQAQIEEGQQTEVSEAQAKAASGAGEVQRESYAWDVQPASVAFSPLAARPPASQPEAEEVRLAQPVAESAADQEVQPEGAQSRVASDEVIDCFGFRVPKPRTVEGQEARTEEGQKAEASEAQATVASGAVQQAEATAQPVVERAADQDEPPEGARSRVASGDGHEVTEAQPRVERLGNEEEAEMNGAQSRAVSGEGQQIKAPEVQVRLEEPAGQEAQPIEMQSRVEGQAAPQQETPPAVERPEPLEAHPRESQPRVASLTGQATQPREAGLRAERPEGQETDWPSGLSGPTPPREPQSEVERLAGHERLPSPERPRVKRPRSPETQAQEPQLRAEVQPSMSSRRPAGQEPQARHVVPRVERPGQELLLRDAQPRAARPAQSGADLAWPPQLSGPRQSGFHDIVKAGSMMVGLNGLVNEGRLRPQDFERFRRVVMHYLPDYGDVDVAPSLSDSTSDPRHA